MTVHVRAEGTACQDKELSLEHRDKIVMSHISGEGYKTIYRVLKVSKRTMVSIVGKWTKYGTTQTLPRAGRLTKRNNRARRALVREVNNNPMTTVTEIQSSLSVRCGRTGK